MRVLAAIFFALMVISSCRIAKVGKDYPETNQSSGGGDAVVSRPPVVQPQRQAESGVVLLEDEAVAQVALVEVAGDARRRGGVEWAPQGRSGARARAPERCHRAPEPARAVEAVIGLVREEGALGADPAAGQGPRRRGIQPVVIRADQAYEEGLEQVEAPYGVHRTVTG